MFKVTLREPGFKSCLAASWPCEHGQASLGFDFLMQKWDSATSSEGGLFASMNETDQGKKA